MIDPKNPERRQRATDNAFNQVIAENSQIRISLNEQVLLAQELQVEVGRLTGILMTHNIPIEDLPPMDHDKQKHKAAAAKPKKPAPAKAKAAISASTS